MKMKVMCAAAAATALAITSSAQAGMLIWDGAYSADWKTQQWDMGTNETLYYGDTGPSLATKPWNAPSGNTAIGVEPVSSAGVMAGSNTILTFWMNTTDNLASGDLLLRIKWAGLADYQNFDERNIKAVYNVDGTNYDYPIAADADTGTWQKVTVDLTQTRYPGWPYVPTTWDPATQPLTLISVSSATNNLVVDNMSLEAVPEPTSLGLIGTGAVLALRRRRA